MGTTARSVTPEAPTSPARELVIPDPSSSVRWHQHDWSHPLARWHYHPEVEVHLIRESSEMVMAGDWAGPFGPGRLSLMGSNRTITRMRLAEGRRLLCGTDLPVPDVRYRVGCLIGRCVVVQYLPAEVAADSASMTVWSVSSMWRRPCSRYRARVRAI